MDHAYVLLKQSGWNRDDQTKMGMFVLSCLSKDIRRMLCHYSAPLSFYLESTHAFEAIFEKGRNVLLHGPAGAGKSTLTNRLYTHAIGGGGATTTLMLAPTQAAAEIVTGGQTVHSFLGIKRTIPMEELEAMYEAYMDDRRGNRYTYVFSNRTAFPSLIFLDEISMVGNNLLRCIDFIMRKRRQGDAEDQPFGGCQVVCVGDFCQLPPVCDEFAFKWEHWDALELQNVSLTRSLRQDGNAEWFEYLQDVREGRIERIDKNDPRVPRVITTDEMTRILCLNNEQRPLIISADNESVEALNAEGFANVAAQVELVFQAQDSLVIAEKMENGLVMYRQSHQNPTERDLEKIRRVWRLPSVVELKPGALYVITFNLDKRRGIYNGQTCIYEGGGFFRLRNPKPNMEARFTTQDVRTSMTVSSGRQNLLIQRWQLALRLGYAQTIHRSQGMTLRHCVANLETLRQPGQFYVAMSRVKRRDDMLIVNPTASRLRHNAEVLFYLRSHNLMDRKQEDDYTGNNDPFEEDNAMTTMTTSSADAL